MIWRSLWNRLRGRPVTFEGELDEELAFHQEMKERAYREAGVAAPEARYAAIRSMGNTTMAREDARAAWQFTWLSDVASDLRYGIRTLSAQPGYTCAATLALTVGLGLNGIVFSVYNALAFSPWALRDADRVVQVLSARERGRWSGVSWAEYRYLRDHTQTMAGITALTPAEVRISHAGKDVWQASSFAADDNFFDLLGTGFVVGRGFSQRAGNLRNPAAEVVLHFETWQRRFGGDETIVGQWIEVNGRPMQVVGVAARGFSGPTPVVRDLWLPAPWIDIFNPGSHTIDTADACCAELYAKLQPGTSRGIGQAELATLSAQFRDSARRDKAALMLVRASFLANPTVHDRALPIFSLIGIAALLVLLLSCTNVANLLVARGSARSREIAVRLSLGATRMRVVRQLVAESLLLSLTAAALTIGLSAWLPGLIMRWISPSSELFAIGFSPDWRVVAFVLGAAFVTTLLFAVIPAAHTVHRQFASALHYAGGRTTSRNRLRTILLTAQIALCATLLSGTALLVRAMQQASAIDPGFRHADVVLLNPGFEGSGVTDGQAERRIEELKSRIAPLPGVRKVGYASVVPLGTSFVGTSLRHPRTGERTNTGLSYVDDTYFETLGIPVLAGRPFTPADQAQPAVVVISQTLAYRLWPSETAVGKNIELASRSLEVIGVVRDVGTRGLGEADAQLYLPSRGIARGALFVRHSGDAGALIAALPALARQVDKLFAGSTVRYSEYVQRARRSAAIAAAMSGIFSSIAICLAFVGLYAVAAYYVAQRTREIGLRMALGANSSEILSLVVRQNARPVIIGGFLGVSGAILLAHMLSHLLYGVGPADPAALTTTIGMLAVTTLLAVLPAARRATLVNPSQALRAE